MRNYPQSHRKSHLFSWLASLTLVAILAAGIYMRFNGLFWGNYQFLHPDERFLIGVTYNLIPVDRIADYFNTAISTLNPHNTGHGFYVYGDFPIILTRYVSSAVFGDFSWNQILQVGRSLSALFDLGSVLLVYLIGKRLFNQKIGLLASAFSSFAVLQIQQSHFYTVDTFATFFATLAVYLSVLIVKTRFTTFVKQEPGIAEATEGRPVKPPAIPYLRLIFLSAFFGIVVGLAAASKVNTVVVAFLLPLAYILIWDQYPETDGVRKTELVLRDLMIGAIFAIIAFRIFQPYAFSGPGFINFQINPKWVSNLKELSNLSAGDVDYPPALQWARRDLTFAAKNITLWGLGIPLSVPFWLGMLAMGWQTIRGGWKKFAIIWVWTFVYFLWQSSLGNPMMRYQMPVYPMFTLLAAWFIFAFWRFAVAQVRWRFLFRLVSILFGVVALSGTAIWAYMFTRIYVDPMTRIEASQWIYENVPGALTLLIDNDGQVSQEVLSVPYNYKIDSDLPYNSIFTVDQSGILRQIALGRITRSDLFTNESATIQMSLYDIEERGNLLARGEIQDSFVQSSSEPAGTLRVAMDPAVNLQADHNYQLVLEYTGSGSIGLLGSAVAVETTWDDPLPVRLDGRDPYGGIYQDGLNFEMYFKDDQDKLNRFYSNLNQSEYIFMSSNRQWGTTTRVPERYPLTTTFYRELLGCPVENEVFWCYSVAEPGDFQGNLGFELVKVFDSYPHLGSWQINDQFAEESFSVYDHPKVMIFKKTDSYNPSAVLGILSKVDLDKVRNLSPAKFPDYPADLELPPDKLVVQRAGGTWANLFDRDGFVNSNPFISITIWYLSITLFGWLLYPLVRLMMPGLSDRGFAYSKLAAMLILALMVWLAGSNNLAISRELIVSIAAFLCLTGIVLGVLQRQEIWQDLQRLGNYFVWLELIGLALFAVFLLVRLGNPDLWHPAKGGEKPMDFAYLNAVIKSTTFPPYDPWYAGGYINYYYYGFVITGIWVKLLGIIPSVAYNLILPLLFSLMGIGAFGFVWNLVKMLSPSPLENSPDKGNTFLRFPKSTAFFGGITATIFMIIIGNLGTLRMIWQGFQRLSSPHGVIDAANLFQRFFWTIKGLIQFVAGANLPYATGDWYWNPSRALPQSPITEFPFFTFLYGDLHAHLIALPITVLVLGWVLSVVASRWHFKGIVPGTIQKGLVIIFGAISIGALRPTNTWDFPTYLILAGIALLYTIISAKCSTSLFFKNTFISSKWQEAALMFTALVGLTLLFYKPFSDWYSQAYSAIALWQGEKSPFWSFFVHWGFFLLVIISWFTAESIEWMATTPYTSLRKLERYRYPLLLLLIAALFFIFVLALMKVTIGWLLVPMAIWSLILIFRNGQNDLSRLVLFITGTTFVLMVFVEVFVLKGDIGRMNTVFKFYLQSWTFLSVSAAYGIVWLLRHSDHHQDNILTNIWKYGLLLIFAFTAMYPLLAGVAKIDDRISSRTSLTLDGMQFMQSSFYVEEGQEMDLSQDFAAIQWMQDNVFGSPVIVEGNTVEYRWGSRFSIYTGLPSVIGWNWHQRQQRAELPSEWITNRVDEVAEFYRSYDVESALAFLEKYSVKYIIVGQLEKVLYPGFGMEKFDLQEGIYWKEVFQQGDTVIYEVIE